MADDKYICFPEEEVLKPREIIMEIMQHMIDRGLTDYSGGNMALRVGKRIYSTQTHSADRYRWKLRPDNIIVTDISKNILEGREEKLSRELDLHIGILQRFPEINCTLHGNTFYSPLLVASGVKPVGVTEVADYYNIKEIPVVPEGVVPLSDEENNLVFSFFEELKKRKEALVAIMPLHGAVVAGVDHDEAFALLEAVENNSKFILFRELLKTGTIVNKFFERFLQKEDLQKEDREAATAPSPEAKKIIQQAATKDDDVYVLEPGVTVLTAEDIASIVKKNPIKKIKISNNVRVTDFAESKAEEIGIQIIR